MSASKRNILTQVTLENAGAAPLGAGIAVFGQTFLQGELTPGTTLLAGIRNKMETVQYDVKTHWADGSVKMAVLALMRPELVAGGSLDVTLQVKATHGKPDQALDLAAISLAHSFLVDVAIHGGAVVNVDVLAALRLAIADGSASAWQQGPLATQARVEVNLPGSQRLVFDVTGFTGGGMTIDAQFNNDRAMEAAGGRVTYDLAVTLDGRKAFQQTIDQGQYQNWHRSFSTNTTDGGQGLGSPSDGWLNIRHDIARLAASGAVADYDLGLTLNPRLLQNLGNDAMAASWDAPLATRGVTTFMPQTGGRGDIGFTTLGNTSWLISQDAGAAHYALGQAKAAAVVPWHFWNAAKDTWLNTDAYPRLWTDPRGGTGTPGDAASTGLTQQVDGLTGWTTDTAHQPDLAYVPYLLTGQRWLLDEVQAQAAFNTVAAWPFARGNDADNLINLNQVRGAAWGLRALEQAASVSPDGSPANTFFDTAANGNFSWMVAQIPAWTAAQGEAHGWIPGEYGVTGALPPWQQDYFASVVIGAATRGNADALTLLNWQSNFLVGRFTQAAQGFDAHDGAAYLIATGDAQNGTLYQSWAEIGAQTAARGWSNGVTGWSQSQGDYPQLALATLAGIWRLTGSEAARDAYTQLVAAGAPFTAAADFARDPTYAIAGPGTFPGTFPGTLQQTLPRTLPGTAPGTVPAAQPGDSRALSITLSGQSWAGNPIAIVLIDGQERFRGEITAEHGLATELHALGNVSRAAEHIVTIRFANDAWGGTADTDRNLFIDGLLADGQFFGAAGALLRNGDFEVRLPAIAPVPTQVAPAPPPQAALAPPPQAAPETVPPAQAAPETVPPAIVSAPVLTPPAEIVLPPALNLLRIALSGDSWQEAPRYLVMLDGVQQGGQAVVHASRAAGEQEMITLAGNFASHAATVTIRFLNDAWGGNPAADRNLYIEGLWLDGVAQGMSASLLHNGDANFRIVPAPVPDPSIAYSLGNGPDSLRLKISGDAFEGHARFLLLVDGVQMGGEQEALAVHAAGESQIWELRGHFTDGANAGLHQLGVRFLNDAWGGDATRDRNLYIESVTLNGSEQHVQIPLYVSGDAFLIF